MLATRAGGYGDEEEGAGGRAELASLLERGRVMRLRAALADETRRSMTYAEFENLCEDCGMDEADARKVGDTRRPRGGVRGECSSSFQEARCCVEGHGVSLL